MTGIHCLSVVEATPERLRALVADKGAATLWYCADAYAPLAALAEAGIDGLTIAPLNAAINRVAAKHRDALIDLDTLVSPDRPMPEPAWSASNMADRGPYLTPLQRNLVRAVVLAEGIGEGRHVVVSDSRERAAALIGRRPGWAAKGRAVLAGIRARLAGIRGLWRQRRAIAEARPTAPALADVDTVLAVWADDRTFADATPKTVFGPLPDRLAAAGRRIGYLALPLGWLRDPTAMVAAIAGSGHPVVLPAELVGWRDVLAALPGSAAVTRRARGPVRLGGVDVGAVVEWAAWDDLAAWAPVQARLFAALVSALRARAPALAVVGYPYENQPWEKRLVAGARAVGTRAVGIQHSPFAHDYLAFFPERRAIGAGLVPDALCVPGSEFARWYEAAGLPADQILVGGAVRYVGAFDVAPRDRSAAAPFTVVCALSIEEHESTELLHVVHAGLRAVFDARLVINFHPAMDAATRDRVRAVIDGPGPDVTVRDEGIAALRREADLVAYNTTGAVFEVLAVGVPVLFVGRHAAIDHDKVPKDLRLHAGGADEVADAVERVRSGAYRLPPIDEVRTRLAAYLAPVDERALIAAFAPGDKEPASTEGTQP